MTLICFHLFQFATAGVVVNELLPDPDSAGGDDGFEWVELYNTGPDAVALEGWELQAGTSSPGVKFVFPPITLESGEFLVVGESQVLEANFVTTLGLGNAGTSADGVVLVNALGKAVDTVIYGSPNSDGWLDDGEDVAESLAPKPGAGQSIGRRQDGVDTDQSGDDFAVQSETTPGSTNPFVVCVAGGLVVINEFLPDPDSEGGDDGFEWVELFNAGGEPAVLDGWVLQVGTSTLAAKFVFPAATLAPGAFLLIGESGVPDTDQLATLGLGNASSSADALALVDCAGVVVDTVVYGSPNSDEWVDDAGDVAASLAPKPGADQSVARGVDGLDTDQSGVDFSVQSDLTPGGPNPVVAPVVCEPATGGVTLNEFVADADGADDGFEWIELHNATDSAVSVAGWMISAGTTDFDSIDVVLPGNLTIGAHGFLVLGGTEVAEATVTVDFSIGNGTEGDGLRLFDCEGTSVDTVVYAGDDGNLDGLPGDAESPALPAEEPGEGESLARIADGVDSDAPEDWDVAGAPTPGATNVRAPGTVPTDPIGGCNCSSPPPDDAGSAAGEPPGRACATTEGPLQGLLVLAAVGLGRRRRGGGG